MTNWIIGIAIGALLVALLAARIANRSRSASAWVFLAVAAVFSLVADQSGILWCRIIGWCFIALSYVRILQLFASEILSGRLRRSLILSDLVATVGYVGVTLWALIHMGVNVSGVFATSAVLTAVVGLSLSDIILNLASGLLLQIEGNYRDGLWIQTDREAGRIIELRARHTRIETADGDYLVIPNSVMLRSSVRVLGQSRRRLVSFFLPYEHSPATIIESVQQALRATPIPDVANTPEAQCVVVQLHPGHIEYGIYLWGTRPGHTTSATSTVLTRTWFALNRLGIGLQAIAQPVEILEDGKARTTDLDGRGAAISRLDLFRTLSPRELERLSQGLHVRRYAPGERILRQGDPAESMFVILNGKVEVSFQHESGQHESLAMLEEGRFFGEMSLLTGAARSASVSAVTEVRALEINKSNLALLLDERPELAAEISTVLSERQATLSTLQESLTGQHRSRSSKLDLLSRIERFFGFGGDR